MKAAHCSPKISAGKCECTRHTALSGPNQPGSPTGAANSMPRKKCRRTFWSNRLLISCPTIWCGRNTARTPFQSSGHDCNQNIFWLRVWQDLGDIELGCRDVESHPVG